MHHQRKQIEHGAKNDSGCTLGRSMMVINEVAIALTSAPPGSLARGTASAAHC